MTSLWFVVPVHGRAELAAICLRQLARTCDELQQHDIHATAVVIGDRPNLRLLNQLTGGLISTPEGTRGQFAGIERDNQFLSRKFNDGIQLACDPAYNARPAEYVVPCGSDDWVHPDLFRQLPHHHTVVGFQRLSFVREDGRELAVRELRYDGGAGIRIYPARIMERLGYRPADEDRARGCDTSIYRNLWRQSEQMRRPLRIEHRTLNPLMLVDWKSPGQQLNTYEAIGVQHRSLDSGDPFEMLADIFPADSLNAMRRHYRHASRRLVAA